MFISFDDVGSTSGKQLEEETRELFESLKLPYPGGASVGRGWSSQASLQSCPWYYKRTYIDGRKSSTKAMNIGTLVHLGLAVDYLGMRPEGYGLTSSELYTLLLERSTTRGLDIVEARRLVEAYNAHYENDYFEKILSVEESVCDKDGNSCRWDLVAQVGEGSDLVPGTYVVDHKTASRFDAGTLDGWANNGELLGEMLHYKNLGFDAIYGDLQGLIVNIIGKQKTPQFARVVLPVNAKLLSEHEDDLKKWNAAREFYKATNFWPKARANCIGQYGKCGLYDECADRSF